MRTVNPATGVQKRPGRPTEFARARFVHICRSAGMPDEAIVGAIAPEKLPGRTLPAKERHRLIRKMVNRWEQPAGRTVRDPERRRELGYALKACGGEWVTMSREPGWSGDERTAAAMERTARQLERQARAVQAAELAGEHDAAIG